MNETIPNPPTQALYHISHIPSQNAQISHHMPPYAHAPSRTRPLTHMPKHLHIASHPMNETIIATAVGKMG